MHRSARGKAGGFKVVPRVSDDSIRVRVTTMEAAKSNEMCNAFKRLGAHRGGCVPFSLFSLFLM